MKVEYPLWVRKAIDKRDRLIVDPKTPPGDLLWLKLGQPNEKGAEVIQEESTVKKPLQ